MDLVVAVRTELFNYREMKSNFINPCCFGEDFATWLKLKVRLLEESRFQLSEVIQEDYGWGFWARRGQDSFWIAVSCVGNRPDEYDGEWGVFLSYDPGLNLLKRLSHKPDQHAFEQVRAQVLRALESEVAMKISLD